MKIKVDEDENILNFEYRQGDSKKVLKAGSVLIDKETKKVGLVFRKKQADYSFAKGHLEEGETLIECAKRETEEETSRKCKIVSEKELGILSYITKKGENVDTYLYLAIDEGPLDKTIPEDLNTSALKIKGKTVVKPEIVGGNSGLGYTYSVGTYSTETTTDLSNEHSDSNDIRDDLDIAITVEDFIKNNIFFIHFININKSRDLSLP